MLKTRVVLLFSLFFAAWMFLIFKAAQIQMFPDEKLTKLQQRQFKKTVTLKPRRGSIVDRFDKEIAISIPSFSLYADPQIIENPKQVSQRIAKHLFLSKKDIYKKIKNKKRRFVWLQRQMGTDKKNEIKSLKIRGLSFIEEPKRVYPNRQLLSQVLGFVGREDKGMEGVELSLNKWLRGNDKNLKIRKDARGRPLLLDGRVFSEAQEGSQVQLTIDSELQYVVERELKKTLDQFEAESAMAIVMDAKSSEVLAMANIPTYDPNSPGRFVRQFWRNRIVTDNLEPGSTLKTFTLAAALEDGVVQPNTRINCENGKFKIGRRYITEADSKHNFESLSVTEVLVNSSNIGTTKVAFKLGDKKLRQFLSKMGFGEKSGISLPGEVSGTVQALPWRPHLLSNISFGHGIAVTPLQMVTAYTAIANGGVLKTPRLIKSVYDPVENEEIEVNESFTEKRVISKGLAKNLRFMLTASAAPQGKVPGFPTAGKTGTAQKMKANGQGYKRGAYISSYVGFIPANDPRFVIYVIVDEPKGNRYYGAEIAAPVFSNIAQFAVNKYRLAPVTLKSKHILAKASAKMKYTPRSLEKLSTEMKANLMPNLKGLSLRQAMQLLKQNGHKVEMIGKGKVSKSFPEMGQPLKKESKVKLFLQSTEM